MLKKFIKKVLLFDIFKALWTGIRCCFKKPVTIKLAGAKRSSKFRVGPRILETKCARCGRCAKVCPSNAIEFVRGNFPIFNLNKCCYCQLCHRTCPNSAIEESVLHSDEPSEES